MKTYYKKHILESIQGGISVRKACANFHVGRATFYRWINKDRSFARKLNSILLTRKPVLSFNFFNLIVTVKQK